MTQRRAVAQRDAGSVPQETPPAVAVRGLVFDWGIDSLVGQWTV